MNIETFNAKIATAEDALAKAKAALAKFEASGDDLLKRAMADLEERLAAIAQAQDAAAMPLPRRKG
jgi:hypothetical protein